MFGGNEKRLPGAALDFASIRALPEVRRASAIRDVVISVVGAGADPAEVAELQSLVERLVRKKVSGGEH